MLGTISVIITVNYIQYKIVTYYDGAGIRLVVTEQIKFKEFP